MDGLEEYENAKAEIQKRKDRLAKVCTSKQPCTDRDFNFGCWKSFGQNWNERAGRPLGEVADSERLNAWLKQISDVKPLSVGWYPSSSVDLRPLLISRTATLKFSGTSYREPNLWIFSDHGGDQWSDFAEGQLIDEARTGAGGLIQKCWKLDPDLPYNGEAGISQRALDRRYSRLLRVALESPEEDFATYILLLNEDDAIVFEFLKKHRLPITHAVFTAGLVSPFLDSEDVFENLQTLGAKWVFDQQRRCPAGWEKRDRILKCGNGNSDVSLVERVS